MGSAASASHDGIFAALGRGRLSGSVAVMDTAADEQRWAGWMLAAQAGDQRAYASLLEEVTVVVRRYLLRRFAHPEFVDDCVQECLLAVHSARHTYQPDKKFRPWLFTIARHKAIDQLRRRQVREAHHTPLDEAVVADLADGGAGDATETAGELLRRLPKVSRDALVLTKLAGYSTAEAAARCGCSEAAMKVRVFRAVRAARKLLEGDGWEGDAFDTPTTEAQHG